MSIVDEFLKSQDDGWEITIPTELVLIDVVQSLSKQDSCYLVMKEHTKGYLIKRAAITGLKVRDDKRKPPQAVVVEILEQNNNETMEEFRDRIKRGGDTQ